MISKKYLQKDSAFSRNILFDSINRDKLALLIAIIISSLTTLIIFRNFFFSQGIVNTGDLHWPYFSEQLSTYIWYEYGQFNLQPSQLILFSWLWNVPLDPALLERIMYFFIYTFMGISAFYVTFKIIEKNHDRTFSHLFIAGIASLIYILNPLNVYYSPHIFILIGYALFPLVIFIIFRYWQTNNNKSHILKYTIALSLLFTMMSGDPRWIIFGVFSFLIIHITLFLTSNEKDRTRKFVGLLICLLPISLVLNAFWIFPLFNSLTTDATAIFSTILTKEMYYMLNNHASVINSLRFQADFWQPTREIFLPKNIFYMPIWLISGLILPIFAFLSFILKSKKKEMISLLVLSLLIILIATAPLFPIKFIDEFYQYFIFSTPLGLVFRTSYKWLLLLSFPFVLLSAFSLSALLTKMKSCRNHKFYSKISIPIILLLSLTLLTSSAINSWPLLTGDMSNRFDPRDLDEDYVNIYKIIRSNISDNDFKIAIWPKVPNWRAPVSIIKDSNIIDYLKKSIRENKINELGSYLSPLNVRYLIFDGQTQYDLDLYNGLIKQNDIREIYKGENLSLFEIEKPKKELYIVNTIYSSYGLCKFFPSIHNSSWLFGHQTIDLDTEYLEYCQIFFGKPFLPFQKNKIIISPFSFLNSHNPSKQWSKAATNDPLHGPWHPYLEKRNINNWDFDYGEGLVFTWAPKILEEFFSLKKKDILQTYDFENNVTGWSANVPLIQELYLSNVTHFGVHSVAIELNASARGWKTISSPLIPVTYGSQYKWEFYVKGKDVYKVHAKVIDYNETKELLEGRYMIGIGSGDFDWKKISFNFIPTSPDIKYMQLQIWHGYETNKTLPNRIWLDDVKIYNLNNYLTPNSLDIPFNVEKNGNYELFIRYFQNKDGGELGTYLDGNLLNVSETKSQINEFIWRRLGTLSFKKGNHVLTIDNMAGFNAVNIFALIPSNEYENLENEIYDLIKNKRIIYIFEVEYDLYRENAEVLNVGGEASNGEITSLQPDSKLWRDIDILRDGNYTIALRLNGSAFIKIDNQPFTVNSTRLNFVYLSLHLEQGGHKIEILPEQYQPITWNFDESENDFEEWKENTPESLIYSLSLDKENEKSCLKAELYNSTWGWKLINSPLIPIKSSKEEYLLKFNIKGKNAHAVHTKIVEYNQSKKLIQATRLGSIGDGTFDWKNVSFKFNPSSENTSFLQLQIWHGHNTSKPPSNILWLDNVKIYGYVPSQVDVLWIYPTKENETIDDLFATKENTAQILTYEKIDPTEYIVTVNATAPFMLSFAESYDPLWAAYTSSIEYQPVPLYSVINGFWINKTGNLEIIIRYKPQDWFETGSLISIIALIGCTGYLLYDWKKNDERIKMIKRKMYTILKKKK